MKTITPYLIKFAGTAFLFTLLFRYFLSYGIEEQSSTIILTTAGVYGAAMFASGWYFGRKDGDYLPVYDVGFRFHLITFLIHNGISELWLFLGFASTYEHIDITHYTLLFWLPFLVIHFFFYIKMRKKSIKGLYNKDLFE